MASYRTTEMRVPSRPAPPIPTNNRNQWKKPNTEWDSMFGRKNPAEPKKKPPPRPPPPKFNQKTVPARPSQLITNLFSKKKTERKTSDVVYDVRQSSGNYVVSSLIDFSPPSSPTLTTRSSSDALSVNSFGSDGQTPSSSSGNTSTVESGFEDDFDFFGLTINNKKEVKDPWSGPSVDPFSPPRPKNPSPLAFPNQTTVSNKGSWMTFSSPSTSKKVVPPAVVMPTIIRPKALDKKPIQARSVLGYNTFNGDDEDDEDDDDSCPDSPPMPTCPPPPPPREVLTEVEHPYGIALFDYQGTCTEDLSFNENDKIIIVKHINENWLMGRKNGVEGLVPTNFINIVVPLDNMAEESRHVKAIYTFHPETWDDLGFQEGDTINVLSRIDNDWLYGECGGKRGQFPATFINNIPSNLPSGRINS